MAGEGGEGLEAHSGQSISESGLVLVTPVVLIWVRKTKARRSHKVRVPKGIRRDSKVSADEIGGAEPTVGKAGAVG